MRPPPDDPNDDDLKDAFYHLGEAIRAILLDRAHPWSPKDKRERTRIRKNATLAEILSGVDEGDLTRIAMQVLADQRTRGSDAAGNILYGDPVVAACVAAASLWMEIRDGTKFSRLKAMRFAAELRSLGDRAQQASRKDTARSGGKATAAERMAHRDARRPDERAIKAEIHRVASNRPELSAAQVGAQVRINLRKIGITVPVSDDALRKRVNRDRSDQKKRDGC